ncbi:MAG: TAXI family TRAP transporter solute-binding subunit [Burkholderiaceae bacterium]
MSTFNLRFALVAAVVGVTSLSPVWAARISMESTTANSVVGLMPQSMAPIWAKNGLDIQLAMDQTLTKSLLKMAQGSLDVAVVPPPAYTDLKGGKGAYAKLGDKGTAAAGNVRALWGFSASNYHPIVWADSGIKDWSQIKGKRVYIGPPAGAGNAQITALIKRGSGFSEGDYEPIKAPWGMAPQSFQDGQFDVMVLPAGTGASAITELGLSRSIRILSLPSDAEAPVELGMVKASVPKGTYKGQVNNDQDVTTWQTVMMVMANKNLSDDVAYQLTKVYMESRKDLAKGNALLKSLPGDNPLEGVIAPLHPGAVKYYKEAGIAIPAALMPQ